MFQFYATKNSHMYGDFCYKRTCIKVHWQKLPRQDAAEVFSDF